MTHGWPEASNMVECVASPGGREELDQEVRLMPLAYVKRAPSPPIWRVKPLRFQGKMVGVARIELATPAMSTQCSTTELHAHEARLLAAAILRRKPQDSEVFGGDERRQPARASGNLA